MRLGEVRNPELMRRLFGTGAPHSSQEISYRKLLGQLDDRGNTATIAHYLKLLADAGIMSGLQKYDPKLLRQTNGDPHIAQLAETIIAQGSVWHAKGLLQVVP